MEHHYRLYGETRDGKIFDARWIEATTDSEAIVLAHDVHKQANFSLWKGDRRIHPPPQPQTKGKQQFYVTADAEGGSKVRSL
jgi:hypothetical protein